MKKLLMALVVVWLGICAADTVTNEFNGLKYAQKLNGDIMIVGWNEETLPAEVVIPATIDGGRVADICDGAFSNCVKMTSINFGTNSVNCGANAFYECTNLGEVRTEDLRAWCGMKFDSYYYSNPLWYAGNLYSSGKIVRDLIIPDGVMNIGMYAFLKCTSITNVDVSTVTAIGSYAFQQCTCLQSVNLRDVSDLGTIGAFSSCRKLKKVLHNGKLTSIPNFTFAWCPIEEFSLNEGIVYVGNQALDGCRLKEITLPSTLQVISGNGFRDCAYWEGEVEFPSGLNDIGYASFCGCSKITEVNAINATQLNTILLWTFCGDISLEMVALPSSITSISGEYAFADCPKLTEVWYEGNAPTVTETNLLYEGSAAVTNYVRYDSTGWGDTGYWQGRPVQVVPFMYQTDTAGNAVITGYCGTVVGALEIPNRLFGRQVVGIGDRAFANHDQMTSAVIPASVTNILGSAFKDCSKLGVVIFEGDAPNIESRAFVGIDAGAVFLVHSTASGWNRYSNMFNIVVRETLESLSITTAALPNAIESDAYSFRLSATGGIQPCRWRLVNENDYREERKEASCITVGLFDTDSGVKRCEHGARSAECLQRAA